MKTYVLAEMGSSWLFGDRLQNGLKLMKEAAKAGADGVKVQWVSGPVKMAGRRKMAGNPYKHLAWPVAWHAVFAEYAKELGVEYVSTVFLPEDVRTLEPIVDRFKVASLECRSPSLWEAMKGIDKNLIVSYGCATGGEYFKTYRRWPDGTLFLQCTAAYPAQPGEVNLGLTRYTFDGLSDHTGNVLTGAFAVCAGAEIVEVHCRLYETPKRNPDYRHSLPPAILACYVGNIRTAERMLGDGAKKIEKGERALMKHRVTR